MNRFIFINHVNQPIEANFRKHIKSRIYDINIVNWIKRCPKRTQYLIDIKILHVENFQQNLFSRKNIYKDKIANFWHKIKQKSISSINLFHKFQQSKKPLINPTIQEETLFEYSKKIYNSNKCRWCTSNEKDNFEHAMTICVKTKKSNNNLYDKCMNILNRYGTKGKILESNLWFHHSVNFSAPNMFSSVDKNLGSMGFLPSTLPNVLKNWGIPEKSINSCLQEIQLEVLTNRYNCWRKRWKCFNKHERTQAVKRKIRLKIKISRKKKSKKKKKTKI